MQAVVRMVIAAVAAASAGCNSLECGAGTIEVDNECVASENQPNRECGPGTVFDMTTGRCVSDLFNSGGGLCGPNTTVQVSDAGVRICVGTGGGASCDEPLPCPVPTEPNSVSLCGRIFDLEDSRPLDDGDNTNGEPYKTVELRVVDPFAFIDNPDAPPITRAVPDSCGRYAIPNAQRPPAGFIALSTEDITAAGGPVFGDNLVQTGIADAVSAGQVLPAQRAWVLRRTTDQMWSTSAGLPSGQTFGKLGVYIPIFISGTTPLAPFPASPTADVKVAIVDMGTGMRVVRAAQDYYFDDSNPSNRRNVVAGREMTGANGTGLYIGQPQLATPGFSGLGNAPAGTCWAINPGASPVGAAFVQERTAEERFCP